jgi:murein DD-endopeptidase MepM/ murein hydrolase activator NlpD
MPPADHAGWGAGSPLGFKIREQSAFSAYGGGFQNCFSNPGRRFAPDIPGADTVWGNRVTDLLRGGSELFPENRTLRAVAKRTLGVSKGALGAVTNRGLGMTRSAIDSVLARGGPVTVCTAVVIAFGATVYTGVGYLHYKHLAGVERAAAERAEHTNAELQNTLDRLRNDMAAAQARMQTLDDQARQQAAASDQGKSDRAAQLTRALEQAQRDLHLADAQRATLFARLSRETAEPGDGQAKQSPAQSSLDKKLQQLGAERDKAASERDQLRARVNELEQRLSLLQSRQAPRPVAQAAPVAAPAPAAVAAAVAIRPAVAPIPATEQPRQVAVVMPGAPNAEPVRAEAPRVAAAPADRGAFTQIERVLASAGVDVKRMFAQLGVNQGEGGPFIPVSAGPNAAAAMSPEKIAALHALVKALPVSAPLESYELGSPFGVRGDPINGRASFHTGVDLRAPYMTPVYATAAGTVTYSGYRDDYGKVVEIDHGNGISTRYAHLHRQTVSVGQRVVAHTQIGFLGSTGRATGPHVHYEVLVNGEPQDPEKFFGLARLVSAAQR